jgi:hypothetical protein
MNGDNFNSFDDNNWEWKGVIGCNFKKTLRAHGDHQICFGQCEPVHHYSNLYCATATVEQTDWVLLVV